MPAVSTRPATDQVVRRDATHKVRKFHARLRERMTALAAANPGRTARDLRAAYEIRPPRL